MTEKSMQMIKNGKFKGKFRVLNVILFLLSVSLWLFASIGLGSHSSWTQGFQKHWLWYSLKNEKLKPIPNQCLKISDDGKTLEGLSEYGLKFNYYDYNSIIPPNGIERIDTEAFGSGKIWDVDDSFNKSIKCFYGVDTKINQISKWSFAMSKISIFCFPKELTEIGDECFYMCPDISLYFEQKTPVSINLGKDIIYTNMPAKLKPKFSVYVKTKQMINDMKQSANWGEYFQKFENNTYYYCDDWIW